MSPLTIVILLALAATVYSLVCGITAMATRTEVGHHDSNGWMFRRVGFQALTVVLLIVAMLTAS